MAPFGGSGMKRLQPRWIAPGAVALLTALMPIPQAGASTDAITSSTREDRITTMTKWSEEGLTEVGPTDWAYQALNTLITRRGCSTGFANRTFNGARSLGRFEAAALLNACLDQVSGVTDDLRRLMAEFAKELAVLKGRVDGLEAKAGVLEAESFSPTTKLSARATLVVGGNTYSGSAINRSTGVVNTTTGAVNTTTGVVNNVGQGSRSLLDAITFNYDVQLNLDTSFSGSDLLSLILRSGNYNTLSNAFGGSGPTSLSTLETAFQEPAGGNVLGIYKLYYQTPLGSGITITLGARVGQEDLLAYWPSAYPNSAVLDVFTMGGSPVAYNYNRGAGAGLWWQHNAWSISAGYVAAHGSDGSPAAGGIGTASAGSSGSIQLAYHQEQWGLGLLYSAVQNGVAPYGTTNLLHNGLNGTTANLTQAFGLNGTWQPAQSSWIPSVSAGWGLNTTTYIQPVAAGTPLASQSWSVGLQWLDAFGKGNSAGMAVGQAPWAISQSGGLNRNDTNWMWEWWTKIQITDGISVTPALFYLWRPLGAETPSGTNFNQLGALIKTEFHF